MENVSHNSNMVLAEKSSISTALKSAWSTQLDVLDVAL